MKYLFLSIFVLCLGLVGCNKGPNTGWECPVCGWGCDESSSGCQNMESCKGYVCYSCGENKLYVNTWYHYGSGGLPAGTKPELRDIADHQYEAYQHQFCNACGAGRKIHLNEYGSRFDGKDAPMRKWLPPQPGYIEEFKPVAR